MCSDAKVAHCNQFFKKGLSEFFALERKFLVLNEEKEFLKILHMDELFKCLLLVNELKKKALQASDAF